MKIICYQLLTEVDHGTENAPVVEWVLSSVTMPWNEVNESIAKAEALNGAYTIEDDGVEETAVPTQEERIAELEEALELLLSG